MSRSVYLAVCAIFKDEAPYLPEWIEFHRLVGVERFLLYDHFSSDASKAVLEPWVRRGIVSITDCPISSLVAGQEWAYADALRRARGIARWLAYIDVDEFLFSPERESLADILTEYEHHPGVVANWQVYGSSGHTSRPQGLVLENFLARARTSWVRNRRVKSIVDPQRTVRSRGPHFFEYQNAALAVTENHKPLRPIRTRGSTRWLKRALARLPLAPVDPYAIRRSSVKDVSVRRLRVNHYAVKSREEFAEKLARHVPSADVGAPRRSRIAPHYLRYHDRNDVHDDILARYTPKIRARLVDLGDTHIRTTE